VTAPSGSWTWRHLVPLGIGLVIFASPVWLPRVGFTSEREFTTAEAKRIGWEDASSFEDIARDIFERVNNERAARGLPPLAWHDGLAAIAGRWSEHMIEYGFFHSTAEFRAHPDFVVTGENIHMGSRTSDVAHVGWMESDGHRAAILHPDFDAVGIGVVCRNDGHMWATQVFGISRHRTDFRQPTAAPLEPIVRRDAGVECPSQFRLLP
jgi:hypothetical protein